MDTWEYQVFVAPSEIGWDRLEQWLNERGEDGWELVAFEYGGAVFKRRRVQ